MSTLDKGWLIFAAAVAVIVFFRMAKVFSIEFWPLIKSGFVQAHIIKTGILVNADIIAAQQTTVWSGGKPVYKISFKYVTLDSKEIEASVLRELTFEEVERYKAGRCTTIKYDAKNPKCIALYDKPLILER
ncbi:DUF3592 domain-containing protein [Pantoea allii]|uniref:DUF3592 domain-containing protein n=2 Tax=Pantoea TaxID=53335 RepID=UPI0024B85B31|nr:DUF3592 domain-containing protein [Pantoea allii]MDJ0038704.1 DUF3592 domain-containing protein [Pantoea allii]